MLLNKVSERNGVKGFNHCLLCNGQDLVDFTTDIFGELKVHYFCADCRGHYYNSRWYDFNAWDMYANGITLKDPKDVNVKKERGDYRGDRFSINKLQEKYNKLTKERYTK